MGKGDFYEILSMILLHGGMVNSQRGRRSTWDVVHRRIGRTQVGKRGVYWNMDGYIIVELWMVGKCWELGRWFSFFPKSRQVDARGKLLVLSRKVTSWCPACCVNEG